jgi:two-component system, NtrC family, response regulator
LFARHLPTTIRVHEARTSVRKKSGGRKNSEEDSCLAEMLPKLKDVRESALSKAEKQYLHDLILLTKRNVKEACRVSGLSQSRLYYLLKKYNINRA